LGEDDDQVKITPLSEDIQLAILKHIGIEEILFMAYVCQVSTNSLKDGPCLPT
jgi:hypothetical protein